MTEKRDPNKVQKARAIEQARWLMKTTESPVKYPD
jgi:hypothetical protein